MNKRGFLAITRVIEATACEDLVRIIKTSKNGLNQNTPNVSVQRPNGIAELIANPMYRYAFPMTNGEIPGITNKPVSISNF